MAGFWPTADQDPSAPEPIAEFARIWRRTPKVAFSKTLRNVQHNSRLAGDDISAEIARLRGGDRWRPRVVRPDPRRELHQARLIDEYGLFVRPIVLGGGKPDFPPLKRPLKVRLVETRTFPGGVVLLRYERGDEPC